MMELLARIFHSLSEMVQMHKVSTALCTTLSSYLGTLRKKYQNSESYRHNDHNNSAYSECGHYTIAVVILVVGFADLLIAFFSK